MMQELNEMRKLEAANQRVLNIQVAANQRLQSQVHTLTERLDAVVDAALAKDAELDAAREEIKQLRQSILDSLDRWMKEKNTILESRDRLLDLLERTQAQRDAAQAQLNTAIAQSHELGAALVVVEAARAYWAMESTDNREQLGSALGDYALAAHDAAREAKP